MLVKTAGAQPDYGGEWPRAVIGQAGLILLGGAAAALLATLVCVVLGIRNGLPAGQTDEIARLFPHLPARLFVPEPRERAQCIAFFAGCFGVAALVIAFPPPSVALVLGRVLYSGGFLLAVLATLVFGTTSFGTPLVRQAIFLELLPPPDHLFLWLGILFLFLAPFTLPVGRRRERAVACLTFGLLLLIAYYNLATSLLAPVAPLGYDDLNHHESAALHSVVQAAFGEIPYRDFTPQYGGYGLFIRLLPWFGADRWGQITLFIALATLLTYAFIVGAVLCMTRSWLGSALAGLIYLWVTQPYLAVPYFQALPVRTLFPAAFMFVFAVFRRDIRISALVTGILVPIALYWNPETGVFCFAATAAALAIYTVLGVRRTPERPSLQPLLLFVASAAAAGFLARYLFSVAFDYRLGANDFFGYAALFARYGFNNLAMPPLDLWLVAAFVFGWLMAIPKSSFTHGWEVPPTWVAAFCALLAGALFFYYQGRSFTGNLLGLSFPLIVGVVIRAWSTLAPLVTASAPTSVSPVSTGAAATPTSRLQKTLVGGAALMSASLVVGATRMPLPHYPFGTALDAESAKVAAFVRDADPATHSVLVLSSRAWIIHLVAGVAPPPQIPPFSSVVSAGDEKQIISALASDEYRSVVVDEAVFKDSLQSLPIRKELAELLKQYWVLTASLCTQHGCLQLMRRRQMPDQNPP